MNAPTAPSPWRAVGPDSTDLSVRAQPGASRDGIVGVVEGALKVRISAPPVEGAANERLLRFLGKEVLGLPPSRLQLVSGERGRAKVVRIPLPVAEVEARINAALMTFGRAEA